MAPYLGYDAETSFIPGTLNTSSSLTVQGGGITQTGGDVNFDSSTFYVDSVNNRVGIGTITPSAVLHVVNAAVESAVRIQGRSSDNLARIDFYKNDNTTFNGRLQTVESSNNLRVRAEGALELYSGGNNQRAQIDSSGGFQFKGAGTAGVTQAVSFNGSAPVNSLVITSGGLVGLGTSSLAAGLTVATYGSQPETNANTYSYPVGRHHVNLGTVPNATNIWAGFVGTYANSSGSCNLLLQPGIQDLGNQAGAYIGGELTAVANTAITFGHLNGAATLAGNSTKLERLRITPTGDLNFKGAGTAGVTQAVSFNGSAPVNSLVITSGGLVGLGTPSPSTTLDCKGNITLGSQNASAANVQPTTGSGTNIAGTHLTLRAGIPTGSGASGQVQIFPSTSSATGGTSPATSASKGLYLRQQITSWDSNSGLFMLNAVFGASASEGNRSGLVNDGTVVTIDGANNGSQSALEIVGSSNGNFATQGFIRFFGSSSKNPYVTIGAFTPGTSYTSGNFFIKTYNSGTEGTVATFTNTGNVGIGTTSPSSVLHARLPGTTTATIATFDRVDGSVSSEIHYDGTDGRITFGTTTNHPLSFETNNTRAVTIDTSQRVGIGNPSPSHLLSLGSITPSSTAAPDTLNLGALYSSSAGANAKLRLYWDGTNTYGFGVSAAQLDYVVPAGNSHVWYNGGTEKARIDSSGRLLVGAIFTQVGAGGSDLLQVTGAINVVSSTNVYSRLLPTASGLEIIANAYPANLGSTQSIIFKSGSSGGGGPSEIARFTSDGKVGIGVINPAKLLHVQSGSVSGAARGGSFTKTLFESSDAAASYWELQAASTATNDILFSKSSTGSYGVVGYDHVNDALRFHANSAECARINSSGYSKFTNANTYVEGGGFAYHEFYRSGSGLGLVLTAANASYASIVNYIQCSRAASSAYSLLSAYSANGVDREFDLKGDGNGYCDGAWTGGGADYAEYFEWSDGNSDEQDRRGVAVVLDNDKIRPAIDGEDPIGVISGNPSVVGDAAWNKWSGKYLRDDFGTYIQEDYEVEDEDGNTVVQQRRKLNPAYDSEADYIPREQRHEWDCVGLMGKLRIRKGQPTGSRWIKMRDISDSVEEWLVR